MTSAKYRVGGMTCASCSQAVTDACLSVEGVKAARVDLSKETVHLSYDESVTAPEFIRKAVKRAGYELFLGDARKDRAARIEGWIQLSLAALFLVLGIMMSLSHIESIHSSPFGQFFADPITGLVLGTICLITLGYPCFKRAVMALRSRRAGMDALVSLSALASFGVSTYLAISELVTGNHTMGYYDSLLMVLSVVTLGDRLESRVKSLSGKRAGTEAKMSAQKARVRVDKQVYEVEPEQVLKGDVALVSQGSAVPADGMVISGEALFDTSSLTGESAPKRISAGEMVYASYVAVEGSVEVECSADAIESLSARLERDSYSLSNEKGRLGKLSDTIAAWFVPCALTLAIVGFLVNFFALNPYDWETSIINGASVLVVSCPCAFGLAVPLASINGFYSALRNGVLFKDGSTFERVRKIGIAIFDKTGTLTDGKMVVTGFDGTDEDLAICKGMESFSSHPIARAILAYRPEVEPLKIENVEEIAGTGLAWNGYTLGKIKDNERGEISAREDNLPGATIAALSEDGKVVASFALRDSVVPGTREALEELSERHIEVAVLTGDGESSAERLADSLGIPRESVYADLLPQEKTELVEKLSRKATCAYCGDGINDLGALAAAGLSIATYRAPQQVRDRADCALLQPGLAAVPRAIDISRRCYAIVVENFIWALVYNVALIPLAMLGILPMWLCSVAMILSNITLMLNSLRASMTPKGKRKKGKHSRG